MSANDKLLACALAALIEPGQARRLGEFWVERSQDGSEATWTELGIERRLLLAPLETAQDVAPTTFYVRRYAEYWYWAHAQSARPRGAGATLRDAVAKGRSTLLAETGAEPIAEIAFPSGVVDELARAFVRELESVVGKGGLQRIARDNAAEGDPAVCHSHDLCDANVAMAAAFQQLFGFAPDVRSQTQTDMWNAAWDRFKLQLQESFPRERALAPRG